VRRIVDGRTAARVRNPNRTKSSTLPLEARTKREPSPFSCCDCDLLDNGVAA
jgi:hypothetical protein